MTETHAIVLTDAQLAVRDDGRCPQCRADESERVRASGFGPKRELCKRCGYAFPLEEGPCVNG